jgi:uncharacterized protein (DUF1800 family)
MGFGPRPGDVERVRAMGLSAYISQQLEPDRIPDDPVEAKVASLDLLQQSNEDLARTFYERQKRTAALLQARTKLDEAAKMPAANVANGVAGDAGAMAMTPAEEARTKAEARRAAFLSLTPDEKDAVRGYMRAQQRIRQGALQLALAKTVRAVESNRQFQEVMVDFWSNHFNVDIRKNACAVYKIGDERDVIRKHAFGKFRDLLGASAKSPAMLVYLDNFQSMAPLPDDPRRELMRQRLLERMAVQGSENAGAVLRARRTRGRGGINENYAREIMELHTLGVDGGYTQKDVQEVARCLTGWTVDRQTGEFVFLARRHDGGPKRVLGHDLPTGGGIRDGEAVLDILASHPSTMRFLSTKLCRRLVSDDPPRSLIDKCVATWRRTDGDLREVYRAIVTSPEFLSRAAYRQKIKSPFEYAVSSVRALGGTIDLDRDSGPDGSLRLIGENRRGINLGRSLAGQVATMGQPLFQYQAPTGWPEDSGRWVSSGGLVARLNFALALTGRRVADVVLPQEEAASAGGSPAQVVSTLTEQILNGDVSPSTRAILLKQAATTPSDEQVARDTDVRSRLAALVLGSPEFQRR